MPGVVGLITRIPRALAEQQLGEMLQSVRHEAFYGTGTWVDEKLGLYIGWTTLDERTADEIPVASGSGEVQLFFSGSDFSETARDFTAESFPATLNGLFHGVVADQSCGTIRIFNDRYGMHRLFVYQAADAFYFACEAKAILAVRNQQRRFDARSLGEFVACSCVLEDRTLFPGIEALPAGSRWTFRNAALAHRERYFEPREWEQQCTLSAAESSSELRAFLEQQMPHYFNGGRPVGVALTGGLDTRVLMAWHKAKSGSLRCYTFGGMVRESQDVKVARRVANACEQPHEVITVGDDFLKLFPHYAERSIYLTEGGVDVYRASDLYVSERARQIAPVKVVGTYGSEILRHAVMFKPMDPAAGVFQREFLDEVAKARSTYQEFRQGNPVTFAVFRQSPWYHSGILALEQSQLDVRSPFLDNQFVRTAFRLPQSAAAEDIRPELILYGNPQLARLRTDRVAGEQSSAFAARLLALYLGITFKAEYAYDYGMPQWAVPIDRALRPLGLQRAFLGRHKLTHFRWWYRDALAGYVRDVLLDDRTLARPYLNRQAVESLVKEHTTGARNHTTAIHKLLTLELLHRGFAD